MRPFVSVIVPVFNAEQTLRPLVGSLRAQDYPAEAFEILLVTDPKSRDGSIALAKSVVTSAPPNVRVIADAMPGSAAHRNLGVASADPRAQYFAFTDADCRVPAEWISTLVAILKKQPKKVAAVGGTNPIPPEDPPLAQVIAVMEGSLVGGGPSSQVAQPSVLRQVPSLPNCNALYRKEVWQKERQDESLIKGQDGEFNYRLRKRGYTFLQTPKTFVWHHRPATLPEHARRMFEYGAATARIAKRHPGILLTRWYGVTASVFVLALLLCILVGFVWRPALLAALGLAGAYVLGVLVVGVRLLAKYPHRAALWAPVLLVLLHFGYATGFWRAVLAKT